MAKKREKTVAELRKAAQAEAKQKPKELHFAGYDFTSGPSGTVIHRGSVDTSAIEDHGADPLGNGLFQMYPSGDIVDLETRNIRLKRFHR